MRRFAFITYDRELADSDDTAFDCGAVTWLWSMRLVRGLGAVINSQGIMQSGGARICRCTDVGDYESGGAGLAR